MSALSLPSQGCFSGSNVWLDRTECDAEVWAVIACGLSDSTVRVKLQVVCLLPSSEAVRGYLTLTTELWVNANSREVDGLTFLPIALAWQVWDFLEVGEGEHNTKIFHPPRKWKLQPFFDASKWG